jgi:hypothetical protein
MGGSQSTQKVTKNDKAILESVEDTRLEEFVG